MTKDCTKYDPLVPDSPADVAEASAAPSRAGPLPWSTRWLAVGLTALVMGTMAWMLDFLTDIELVDQLTKRAVARFVVPVQGFFYGEGSRRNIVVVHIDAQSLAESGSASVLPYRYHARVLRQIAARQPKAIFVDIQFEQTRDDPSIDLLVDTLCEIKTQGIQVFMAAGGDPQGGRLRAELEVARAEGCFRKVSVFQTPDSFDRLAWTYPLTERIVEDHYDSAALALYNSLHRSPLTSDTNSSMALVWGTRSSAMGLGWAEGRSGRQYCRDRQLEDLLPFAAVLGSVQEVDSRPQCVFHESLPARRLLRATDAADSERIGAAIRDKAVLYGLSSNPYDMVASLAHGEIPGVYFHAMALDNLMTYGRKWKRASDEKSGGALLYGGFVIVSLAYLLATLAVLGHARHLRQWSGTRSMTAIVARLRDRIHAGERQSGPLDRYPRMRATGVAMAGFLWRPIPGLLMSALRFVLLAAGPGLVVAVIAHQWLDLGLLTYIPVIVMCAGSEALQSSREVLAAMTASLATPVPPAPSPPPASPQEMLP
ncbi:CHASE2 domain-containing protein [Uliginosibacterium sp. H1]|uniref:CHASE2 domain-containing protein n=1 Tax=Uliginosibacterium sp. H1 TaxID=3114757 RepID=UPI002E187F1C|nr:CHASE2 domain-containing protein [Uliginosibacterium sp. H1]